MFSEVSRKRVQILIGDDLLGHILEVREFSHTHGEITETGLFPGRQSTTPTPTQKCFKGVISKTTALSILGVTKGHGEGYRGTRGTSGHGLCLQIYWHIVVK